MAVLHFQLLDWNFQIFLNHSTRYKHLWGTLQPPVVVVITTYNKMYIWLSCNVTGRNGPWPRCIFIQNNHTEDNTRRKLQLHKIQDSILQFGPRGIHFYMDTTWDKAMMSFVPYLGITTTNYKYFQIFQNDDVNFVPHNGTTSLEIRGIWS